MGIQGTASGILSADRTPFGPFGGTVRNKHALPDSTIESLATLRPVFTADSVVTAVTAGTAFTLDDEQEVRPRLCVCPQCAERCDDVRVAGMIAAGGIRAGDTFPSPDRMRKTRMALPVRSSPAFLTRRSGSSLFPAGL